MSVRDDVLNFLRRPGQAPGCYDEPEFLALEKRDSNAALLAYAEFVLQREQTETEDQHVRRVVAQAAQAFTQRTRTNLRGQCVAMTCAMIKILERHGCWAFGLTGSVCVSFPSTSRINDRYFRIHDPSNQPGLFDGHAWIVAPPYMVVDLTVRAQRWQGKEAKYIPRVVTSEDDAEPFDFRQDLWTPGGLERMYGPPGTHVRSIWEIWRPRVVRFEALRPEGAASCAYQPQGVSLPDGPLEEHGFKIDGAPLVDFYDREILPHLK